MKSMFHKGLLACLVAFTIGPVVNAAEKPTGDSERCASIVQRQKAEGLLDTLRDTHIRNGLLYARYMEKGGLMRSRAFQWACTEAGAQNLEIGKSVVDFFDWKVSKSPQKLSEEVWRQLSAHYDLSFMDEGKTNAEEAARDAAELNSRCKRTGETQGEFLAKAMEVAEISADPEKLADLKKYIAEHLPDFGKAVVRYEVARRQNAANLATLQSPWTIGFAVAAPVSGGVAGSYLGHPILGAAIGAGAFAGVLVHGWTTSFFVLMDAMKRDRRVTQQLKQNMTAIDVDQMATQYGLDPGQYTDMIADGKSRVYQPYKSIVDHTTALEVYPVEFTPSALAKSLGQAADHYSAYGSTVAGLSLPLRQEIVRRSNEIMDAKRLGRLEKAMEPIVRKLAAKETVSHADVKGMMSGAVELRIQELLRQAQDMTLMEHDLRLVRDTSRTAYHTMREESLRLFKVIDALEQQGTEGLEDRYEDIGRIEAEVKSFDTTAMSLEAATVAISAARTLIDAELEAMQIAAKTIELNPGGQDGLVGETLANDINRLAQIIADRKGYAPRAAARQAAAAKTTTPIETVETTPDAAPAAPVEPKKETQAKPKPAI